MGTIAIPEEKLNKVLADIELLIEDVASLFDQDDIAQQRMADIKADPSLGKSEKGIDEYLKKRGVNIG